jgi:cell division GTPase FtsZ
MSDDDVGTLEEEYEEYEEYEEGEEEPEKELEEAQDEPELETEESWDLPADAPTGLGDFDFVEAYDDEPADDDRMLQDNTAPSAINCAFIGIGGGGGKMAKAFLDLGYNKTLLINTTEKDQPGGVNPENFLLIPGADGVAKDIKLGKEVLGNNSALVEDALRTRIGKVDWIFVLAGAGGGTGSASHVLHKSLTRYLASIEAGGKVVYIASKPTAQELLNPTIKSNCGVMLKDIKNHPHIIIDNEKQLHLLRGKVGMLNMYPAANRNFAKLLAQVFKLADEPSPIQAFDSKDLERCLSSDGRMLLGSTVVRDATIPSLGASIFQGCLKSSPCAAPSSNPKTGVLLLIITPEMGDNPKISNRMEAAFSYVGGRAETLFSGVYVQEQLPGLIALTLLGGM